MRHRYKECVDCLAELMGHDAFQVKVGPEPAAEFTWGSLAMQKHLWLQYFNVEGQQCCVMLLVRWLTPAHQACCILSEEHSSFCVLWV